MESKIILKMTTTEQINNINEVVTYITELIGYNNLEQHHIDMIDGLEEIIEMLRKNLVN